MKPSAADEAAAAIAAKADRLLASIEAESPSTAERRRHAEALHRLAQLVPQGTSAVTTALQAAAFQDLTPADRQAAATEVASLASRRESQGTERNLASPVPPGWERGGDDHALPIHRGKVREAVELYALAHALHSEEYWAYLRGLLLERLGEYAAAAAALERVTGSYAKFAAEQAERCRAKSAGAYDAKGALEASFASTLAAIEGAGEDTSHVEFVKALIRNGQLDRVRAQATPQPDEPEPSDDPDRERLDRAALTAQSFAELLVDGDFNAAHALLAPDLRHVTSDDLREAYERMTAGDAASDGGPVQVAVIRSEANLSRLGPNDAWVYVAISGEEFNEAVAVIVTDQDGEPRIKELQWGRP